ncbi:MAG: hypothetical protein GC168_20550 [Candidatus Hydrogenedens sp.]|nr:hypothetical protein [Candidatus Hydrogenedens sp.]
MSQSPPDPIDSAPSLAAAALDHLLVDRLIVGFETGGRAYYGQGRPLWPGGDSGVAIGCGYDLGYHSAQDLRRDWSAYLPSVALDQLAGVCGLTGVAARAHVPALTAIKIPYDAALTQFYDRVLPVWTDRTLRAFPGSAALPPACLTVLVSLTYNRGPSFKARIKNGRDTRSEMRSIRGAVEAGNWPAVPALIRAMKTLWQGPETPFNLRGRREAEAKAWEAAMKGAKS